MPTFVLATMKLPKDWFLHSTFNFLSVRFVPIAKEVRVQLLPDEFIRNQNQW